MRNMSNTAAAAAEMSKEHKPLVIWPEDKLLADTGEAGSKAVIDLFPVLTDDPFESTMRPGWKYRKFVKAPKAGEYAEWAAVWLETGKAYGYHMPNKERIVIYINPPTDWSGLLS